ncbi:MAG TPA: GAF domain-containing protein, partial [Symbiobacteriaceae bacterium]|nr:GAF domain-containing protein [Symbiobacteriaceae bacterium]
MSYNRLRWGIFIVASLFVLLVESLERWYNGGPLTFVLWHAILLGGIFHFTTEILRRFKQLQDRLREEAGRFHPVFEAAGLGVILLGPDCIITAVNRSAEALSGWGRDDLVGRRACSELLSNASATSHGCVGLCREGVLAGHEESAMCPAFLLHREGRQIPVMVSAAPLHELGGYALIMWDVSERVRLEAETALRRRQAEGLVDIGREIAGFRDLKHSMDRILDQARDLFGMDLVAWGLMEDGVPSVSWQAARGTGSPRLRGAVQSLDGMVMGRVLTSGRPFITQNLAGQGAGESGGGLFDDPPMLTAMAVPLLVRENVSGVLLCASTRELPLTDEDVMFFTHLGSYIATAVENAGLLEQVQHLATLEERQRLAREMHDSFGQLLTYLGVRHHLIARFAELHDTAAVVRETASLKQVLQEAHADVRRSIFQLKESGQPKSTMVDRWRQLLMDFEERTGIHAVLDLGEGVPKRLPEQPQLQLTRIVQETLTNVRNHSGALSVAVRLSVKEQTLLLVITDDG